jgi:hypothetical protein
MAFCHAPVAAHSGGSVSGYHELMTSLTAQRSPATGRRAGSRAVFLYIADRVESSLFCRVVNRRTGYKAGFASFRFLEALAQRSISLALG